MKAKILITGGTGYIGSHTAVELIQAGYEVEILDNLYNSKREVLGRIARITGVQAKFHEVDLRDFEAVRKVLESGNFQTVMHFAGLKAVGESVEQPLKYYDNNVGGTINLLRAMKIAGVNQIVFSSSARVYGEQEAEKYDETMMTGMKLSNPYGRTKYMIEEILKDLAVSDPEFRATILRYFNPIGAHPSGLLGEDPNDRPNNLMPIVMKVAAGEIPVLSVYGKDYPTADGTCVRDYIHVVDLAKGHVAAMDKMESEQRKDLGLRSEGSREEQVEIYNLGSGVGTSVLEMVRAFSEASGRALPYKIAERRAGDLPTFYANPAKAERELGWKTERTVADAMNDTLNYLRKSCGVEI